MNIRGLHDRISTGLGTLKNKVEIESANNEHSLNILLETTFLNVLNVLFDYNLVNANLLSRNFPGIDGLDAENRIFVQITSTFSNEKIESTVDQIIDKNLYHDFDKLFFVFLKGKKKISKAFKDKIDSKIQGRFVLDFEFNLIDTNDVYRILANEQNIDKSLGVKKILDSVLYNIPQSKVPGFDFVGVSFDEEEFENVAELIETIIKSGINVVVNSKKIYEYFKNERPRYFDYLIMLFPNQSLDFLTKYIFVVSNHYIKKNIDSEKPECSIFLNCIEKSVKPQLVSFTTFPNKIKNKNFKNPKTLNVSNLKKIEEVIQDLFAEKPSLNYSFSEIKDVLVKLFPMFTLEVIADEKSYCLYNFKKSGSNSDLNLNYLIFGHEYRRNEVIEEFNKKYKNKFLKNLTVLLPKDYNQSTNLRIKFIRDKFVNSDVFYLDEYLFDYSLSRIEQTELLSNEVFISPFFEIKENIEKLDDIFDWLKNDSHSPVAFIIGSGGDGKTTVCQKIHDEIIHDFEKSIVIFLDAQSYINEIKHRERVDNWKFDLHSIFEICNSKAGDIDLTTFKSNFALGNITVIIDGIDEIISTLPNFSLKDFVEDFNVLKELIGRGKLIINCRDIYINELLNTDVDFSNKHKVFKLLKFNVELAKKFFEKHFTIEGEINVKKVNECIKILNEFYEDINGDVYVYSPFVLEIIVLIVENNFDYEEIEYVFNSEILLRNNSSDYLIYKICQREIAKKENHGFIIPVDDYIKLLSLAAVEKNGVFNDDDFISFLRKIKVDLSSEKVKNSLRDNPFFCLDKNGSYVFRFDFYNSAFKYNAIYSKIVDESGYSLSDSLINTLSNEFKFNSIIFRGLKNKIKDSDKGFEFYLDRIKKIVLEIENYKANENNYGTIFLKKLAISNLVVFLISISDNKFSNSKILKYLFEDTEQSRDELAVINGFYFIDVPIISKITFDFSNMYFINCHIDNYPQFLDCSFLDTTFFDRSCDISNIYSKGLDLKKITFSKNNFDDKILSSDNSLYKIISIKESGGESMLNYFKKYFKSFTKGNKLNYSIPINSLFVDKNFSLEMNEINNILYENGIISSFTKEEITMNSSCKNKVSKFLNQNITFAELNRSIKKIENLIIDGGKENI
ncbi:hypothetical protein FLJC2902T_12690 [Flavobacterium limnosediminis JC2902]|uniref:SMEK domain-containing protein n=1 Tax=Flavobacterium limnosediminis JC2902 TaxID=1341181 RepID=V6SPS9_9FLAO|nr:SMEK domain-containing protein [Flavobacterium limnosediminis]ESU28678.1 hypothetical protein FLJC2902T_12690 [Flavobacterium limnosediminis JC2902]